MRCRKSAPSADFMAIKLQVIESRARRNLRDQLVQPPAFYSMKEMKSRDSNIFPRSQFPGTSTRGQICCIPQGTMPTVVS